ncbi:hypothetical protein ACFVJH_18325 [Streptomyces decoyicus]|uniref:hypothetical protein n=1 Tax=Streptomyces decoyicus TaxID=249567 RepID=UPI0036376A01
MRYTSARTTDETATITDGTPADATSHTATTTHLTQVTHLPHLTQRTPQPRRTRRTRRRVRSGGRAAALGTAALALVLPLAACSSEGESSGPAGGSSSSSAGSAPSPSQTPTVDPAAYRHALTGALGPLDSALRAIDRAHEGGSLNKALDTAATKADTAATALQTVATPDNAIAGNSQLVSSLRSLGQDLKSARGTGGRCATSPRVELGTARGPQSVKEAGRALTALGYDAALRLPRTEQAKHRRLGNGDFVRDGSRGGLGRLTVRNGTGTDAVVTLTRGTQTAFSVYVRKGSNATVRSVNSGSYTVYFTTGEDWNSAKNSFTRQCSFEKFDDKANFRTVRVAGGTQYTVLTFTLNKVIGGNASTSTVPPGDFPS